jgi:potassium efflux system protein
MRASLLPFTPWVWTLPAIILPAILGLAPSPAWSQSGAGSPPSEPASPPGEQPPSTPLPIGSAPSDLTVEALKGEMQRIETDEHIDAALKPRLLEEYKKAVEHLKTAESWAAKTADLAQKRQGAPELLKTIQAELAKPAQQPKPEFDADESIQQLEQRLAQQEAELKTLDGELSVIEGERKGRAERRAKIPELSATAKQRLEETGRELEAAPLPDEPPALTEARRRALAARKRAIEQELLSYDEEIRSYDARGELLTARRDLKVRQKSEKEALVKSWQELVNQRRRDEAQRATREAQQKRREATLLHPIVKEFADENVLLTQERSARKIVDRIETITGKLDDIKKINERREKEFQEIRQKLRLVGLTRSMGLLLRGKLEGLPDLGIHQRNIRQRQEELTKAQFEQFDYQDARDQADVSEHGIRKALEELPPEMVPDDRGEIATAVRELLDKRRQYLDAILAEYDEYLSKLAELDLQEGLLIQRVHGYAEFIRERILWVPSHSLPRYSDLRSLGMEVQGLIHPERWGEIVSTCWTAARQQPVPITTAVLAFGVLMLLSPWLRRRLREQGETASRRMAASIAPTLGALPITVLLAAPWPVLLYTASWWVGAPMEASPFAKAVAAALRTESFVLFTAILVRQLCRPNGLGEAHFDWSPTVLRTIRLNVFALATIGLPVLFLVVLMESGGEEDRQNILGRAAFIVGEAALAVFLYRVLRPSSGVLREHLQTNPNAWISRLRHLWFSIAVGTPVALMVLAAVGFFYTAMQLSNRLLITVWWALVVLVVNATLLRWVLVTRRGMALEQYRKRRAAVLSEGQATDGASPAPQQEVPEPHLDLSAISLQTRKLIRSFAVLGLAAVVYLAWADVLPALRVLDHVRLWQSERPTTAVSDAGTSLMGDGGAANGSSAVVEPGAAFAAAWVTLADVGFALLVLLMTFVAAKNLPGLLEILVLKELPLTPGGRYAITTVSRYVLTIIGLVVAFDAIGVTWSKVQWLAAAITVGLGFGLQEIFANFVSGLIILFERPIRVGDIVQVGEFEGRVSRIHMRATIITDWNRKELIIPNKEFVTGKIVNSSLSDQVMRLVIPVGIAYGSDTHRARELLLRLAQDNPRVHKDPAPQAYFLAFGASALDFELRVFFKDMEDWMAGRHELHVAIYEAFREAGIEIAFPQQDIHIRSIDGAIPLRHEDGQARPAATGGPPAQSGIGLPPDRPHPEAPTVPPPLGAPAKPSRRA